MSLKCLKNRKLMDQDDDDDDDDDEILLYKSNFIYNIYKLYQ